MQLQYIPVNFINLQRYFFDISQYFSSIFNCLCRHLLIIVIKHKLAHNSPEDSVRTKSVIFFLIHLKKSEVRKCQEIRHTSACVAYFTCIFSKLTMVNLVKPGILHL